MRPSTLIFAAILGLLSSCSTFKKDPQVLITVFSEGSEMDSPKTIFRREVEGRQLVLKVIPEFTHRGIVAFHPFQTDDGTYGITMKLDFKAANALEIVTRMKQGEVLVSMVNATVVDYVTIDQVIADGIFTIWRGLPEELIASMDKEYPRIQALKDADADSSSDMLDMVPSTGTEKKDALKRVKKSQKAKEEADKRAARGEFEPELPAGAAVPLSEALKNAR